MEREAAVGLVLSEVAVYYDRHLLIVGFFFGGYVNDCLIVVVFLYLLL
jgi:hypothetical protein